MIIMADITLQQLRRAMPQATAANCERFLEPINVAMRRYLINTPLRQAHFLCQIAWESGQLRYTEEIASGTKYEGRKDLGNTQTGDGVRYKGRGLIQITGRANYKKYGIFIGKDMEDVRQQNWLLLKEPKLAADSAGWFWFMHGLSKRADRDEHTNITKIINGSTVTAAKRLPYLRNAKIALGLIKE